MAETLKGLKRTGYCGSFRASDIGKRAVVYGWTQKCRNLGGLIFIDLRDKTGLLQLTFDATLDQALLDKAASVRSEFVLAAVGTIRARQEAAKNSRMPTGEVELAVTELRILSVSQTPPFEIVEDSKVSAELRLKYRYLDLRRPDLMRNLLLRSQVATLARNFFAENDFAEIETPMLIRSSPEGARDYLVPSRVHPGSFYALPQSPQQYKQILMIAGFDRYIQLVRCFRDEDLRADRQPEFTQIDLEMSFVDVEDVLEVNERFLQRLFKETLGMDIPLPLPRLTYREAMDRFGSDKPDLRFGFELRDLSDALKDCEFKVFAGALAAGGSVRAINVKGAADRFTRKEIDSLTEFVKTYRAKGLAWIRLSAETTSSFTKFLKPEETEAILSRMEAEPGDLILVAADRDEIVFDALGALRCECAKRLGLLKKDDFKFLWVTEFPLFEYDEEAGRFAAKHHPFTSPMDEDLALLDSDPGKVRAKAYDIVLNGTEIGGGSIRIYDTALQQKMFEKLGFTMEQAWERFGFLMEAFKYGAPPHGGLAYGLDRLVMLICGEDSIRDVIAFPKVQNASELMSGCPAPVDDIQLRELELAVTKADNAGAGTVQGEN